MYIEKIKSPADLKKLDLKALQTVADETRQAVLNRVRQARIRREPPKLPSQGAHRARGWISWQCGRHECHKRLFVSHGMPGV
mgnify:CR=1 FL=1